MTSKISYDTYFDRIGYEGPRSPTLEVLNAITAAHVHTIPFENLDILSGKDINIDIDSVYEKLVRRRRGGYCFEQNGLLLHVLRHVGFAVTPISARVRIERARDFIPPRTHVFLRVEISGNSYLTDAGIGGVSLTSAIQLCKDIEQKTPHETRRIVYENNKYFHQVRYAGGWNDVCEFTLEEMPAIDCELANWFTSAHPASHFKDRLIVARAAQNGQRYTVVNRELSIRHSDGVSQKRIIGSPGELLEVLESYFGLEFPRGTEFNCPGIQWDK